MSRSCRTNGASRTLRRAPRRCCIAPRRHRVPLHDEGIRRDRRRLLPRPFSLREATAIHYIAYYPQTKYNDSDCRPTCQFSSPLWRPCPITHDKVAPLKSAFASLEASVVSPVTSIEVASLGELGRLRLPRGTHPPLLRHEGRSHEPIMAHMTPARLSYDIFASEFLR